MKTMMTTRRPRDRSRRPASRLGAAAIALGLLALSFAATSVRAETILITLAGAPVANGPNWDWTYNVQLTGFSSLNSGDTSGVGPPPFVDVWFPDFGEIYDFAGMVGTPTFSAASGAGTANLANADFSVSTPNQDGLAEAAIFGGGSGEVLDDQAGPNANNIKLSFVRVAPYTNPGATTVLLGQLTATSAFRFSTVDTYIGTDTKPNGMSGKNSSTVEVPVVPTPKTVWGGLALFSVMGLVRARRLAGF